MGSIKRYNGMTLIEVMVTASLFLVFMIAILNLFSHSLKHYARSKERLNQQIEATQFLIVFAKDVRESNSNIILNPDRSGITLTKFDCLKGQEKITYWWAGSNNRRIMRQDVDHVTQVAKNISFLMFNADFTKRTVSVNFTVTNPKGNFPQNFATTVESRIFKTVFSTTEVMKNMAEPTFSFKKCNL